MAADLSTARHARVYALGAVLRNVISFVMLPIYTRHLSPADYGTIELLSMMVDVVGLIVGLRIEDAIFRYWHDTPNRDARLSVVSNALVVAVFANLVGVGFILVFAKPLTAFMFGSEENYPLTALFGLTLLFQALISVPLAYVRLQQRPWLYLSVSVARLILQLSLNIYFIVIRDMKSEGVIYSAVISSFVCGLAALVYLLRAVPFKIEQRQIVSMVRFSGPLILASVAAFYSTYGDRYFLRVYHGLADVGIYGLAYKFGFLLMSLVWEPFTKIWDIRRYQILKGEYVDETYNDNFVVMFGVMILAALGISVFLPDLLRIMAGPAYADAALVAPVILLACLGDPHLQSQHRLQPAWPAGGPPRQYLDHRQLHERDLEAERQGRTAEDVRQTRRERPLGRRQMERHVQPAAGRGLRRRRQFLCGAEPCGHLAARRLYLLRHL